MAEVCRGSIVAHDGSMITTFVHCAFRPIGRLVLICATVATLALSAEPAAAQDRDGLLNGAVIGGAVGAGVGIAFTHAVRVSDLTAGQYARSAIIFGALGAGAGLGVDALFQRAPRPAFASRRLWIAPAVWRNVSAVAVKWRW
jgi:hypothetical protein